MENLRGKIVLVAAADAGGREAVAEEFRKAGCQTLLYTGGIEAYEAARDRTVDAVVTAARLSSGEPAQLLYSLRRLHFDIPVVLYGSSDEAIANNNAFHLGFTAHFRQAFPTEAIAQAVARALLFVDERRKKKIERVVVAGLADLSFGTPPAKVRAPVLNLSRGGIFVSIDKGFPDLESTVAYELYLSDKETSPSLAGQAFVRWVRENPRPGQMAGVGLEFTDLPDEARAMLEEHMKKSEARKS